jgi:hypothetical protein
MVHQDFMKSHIDDQLNRLEAATWPKYLLIAQYSVRQPSHSGSRPSPIISTFPAHATHA